MKQILIVCLLGIGMLLPSQEVKSSEPYRRIVDVHIDFPALIADSDTEDGTISKIEIYKVSTGEKVRQTFCSGYSCSINLSGLPAGNYNAKVICQYTTYTQGFTL